MEGIFYGENFSWNGKFTGKIPHRVRGKGISWIDLKNVRKLDKKNMLSQLKVRMNFKTGNIHQLFRI